MPVQDLDADVELPNITAAARQQFFRDKYSTEVTVRRRALIESVECDYVNQLAFRPDRVFPPLPNQSNSQDQENVVYLVINVYYETRSFGHYRAYFEAISPSRESIILQCELFGPTVDDVSSGRFAMRNGWLTRFTAFQGRLIEVMEAEHSGFRLEFSTHFNIVVLQRLAMDERRRNILRDFDRFDISHQNIYWSQVVLSAVYDPHVYAPYSMAANNCQQYLVRLADRLHIPGPIASTSEDSGAWSRV